MLHCYRDVFHYDTKIRYLCNYLILKSQQNCPFYILRDTPTHIQNTLFQSISVISPVTIETRTGIFGIMHIKYMDSFF
jgi:hypothetical protein